MSEPLPVHSYPLKTVRNFSILMEVLSIIFIVFFTAKPVSNENS